MTQARAFLYIMAVVLLVVAAMPVAQRASFALMGAACALLAFALPTIYAWQ